MENCDIQTTSHKGEKLKSYTLKFKLDAISYAEIHGNHAAEKKYKVDRKRIREWKHKKLSIQQTVNSKIAKGKQRKRMEGAGRKPFSETLDAAVLEWIHERRGNCLPVSRKLIMKKATLIHGEMVGRNELTEDFKASVGWLRHFMKRYGLSLRRKTSMAQKDPDQVIDKLVAFILHVRRVAMKQPFKASDNIAMDETPIWADMVSNTTVDVTGGKTVTVKTTGHEKSRVSVCLAAKADGTKLPPFIVFKGAKREVAALDKEFKGCHIASSPNAWMNTELTHEWINKVLGTFSFTQRYLVWDSYECHIEDSVKSSLKAKKIDVSIIPGGCTKYIQAPDMSWNKPFKAYATEMYDKWLAEEGIKQFTAAGNLKAPPRRTIVQWILQAWEQISSETIKTSFKSCALNLAIDGTEDGKIHCFKEGQPCHKGKEILESQLSILKEDDTNPFLQENIKEDDVVEATPGFLMIDSDQEGDEDIDI